MSGLDVLQAHALPIKEIRESLGSVTLVNSLTTGFDGEIVHVGCELVNTLVNTLHSAVDDIDTIIGTVLDEFLHVAAESR